MPSETINPIILPPNHHVTQLIIRHVHENVGHSGRSHTLTFEAEILDSWQKFGHLEGHLKMCHLQETKWSERRAIHGRLANIWFKSHTYSKQASGQRHMDV